jgi:hypothetical protein
MTFLRNSLYPLGFPSNLRSLKGSLLSMLQKILRSTLLQLWKQMPHFDHDRSKNLGHSEVPLAARRCWSLLLRYHVKPSGAVDAQNVPLLLCLPRHNVGSTCLLRQGSRALDIWATLQAANMM